MPGTWNVWNLFLNRKSSRRRLFQRPRLAVEQLESRWLPSVNVLTFHNDTASTGVNANETTLTPANVKVNTFSKLYTTAVDGQVYAEPLVDTAITIAAGVNTSSGAAGVHDVVFVATEHDSLYALDATVTGGGVLWQRRFTDITTSGYTGTNAGTNVNNPLGASAISSVPQPDVISGDISTEIGITGTPVIDPATNTLYVVVKTKETISGTSHWIQRLHAIKVTDGTDRALPYQIGDTTPPSAGGFANNTNNTPIYVNGTGAGNVGGIVQFNALREAQRGAVNLTNSTVYVEWASHGDNGPYHGWVATWNVANLTTTGFQLTGVLNVSPNNSEAGIWQGGGRLAFESNGTTFYFETGNGTGGAPTLNGSGFPTNANYNEALVKVVPDSVHNTPTNQNANGWGLQVSDYFIPYNVAALDGADSDFGSGAPILLPNSAGITGHPHLMLASGKEGKIYIIDRDNMGKFNGTNDNVLNAVPDGSGHNTPPVQISGSLSTAAYFNGKIYWVSGYTSTANAYVLNSGTNPVASLTETSLTSVTSFGYLPGSVVISANGTTNGIAWVMDRNANLIRAYDAATFATELWDSGQKAGGADSLGATVKFAVPTVANGEVYVGTSNSLVVYGLAQPPTAVPNAPTLSAAPLGGTSINLNWTDTTANPNTANFYSIEDSTDGTTFSVVTTAPAGSTSVAIGGLQPSTKYYFRIRGNNTFNSNSGYSSYSNIANATTTTQVPVLDFSAGFTGATSKLTLNGSAALNGSKLEVTNGNGNQAGSAFSTAVVDVTKFNTQFTFQLTNGANTADGFTFTIEHVGPTALGGAGGALGYQGIGTSIAVKFDLYNNAGEGADSTGLYTNGAVPQNVGSIDLSSTGIDLHSGHTFQVYMSYDGTTLSVTIQDTQTNAQASQSYTINIPGTVGSTTADVGFTGGTGGVTVTTDILTWTYSPIAAVSPNAPSGLGASAASATSIALNWTNNATNQTGFHLDRATDAGFTQSLSTQTLPSSPNTFTDTATGLAPGSTFYYRLRAYNAAGDSGNSNTATVTIPVAPPKPTNQQVTEITATEIDVSWQDNAGHQADGYHIMRAVNGGTFTQVAALPPTSRTPPSTYEWSDTNLTPNTSYDYHIIAYNVSGNNDFAGVSATTLSADTVVLSSSVNASTYGQNVTFTATVSGSGTPTGTVQFVIDGSNYGSVATISAGKATITDAALGAGTHAITADYNGDTTFGANSGTLTGGQAVNTSSSSTSVSSSVNASVFGQSVTFTATVSAVSPGGGTAGGAVQFVIDGSNFGGAVTMVGGSATVSNAALSLGTHTVTASYSGDSNFITSSGSLTGGQTVNKDNSSVALSSSANGAVFGQNVTFAAILSAVSPGTGTPTGTVQFVIDSSNYGGAVTLAGGSATVSTAALSAGTHTVTATYSGDSNFVASNGALPGGQTVSKAGSTTAVSSSVSPTVFGQSVTFTATISVVSPGAGSPGGSVQFVIDGSNYGSAAAVAGGSATVSATALSVGTHTVVANYNGDGNFAISSGTLAGGQTVTRASSNVAIISLVNPSVIGQAVTFTVTVKAVSPGGGTPSGTVQFVIDGSNFGSALTLAAGSATISDAALSVGTHTVTTSYGGDSSFFTGTGSLTGGQTVVAAGANASISLPQSLTGTTNSTLFSVPININQLTGSDSGGTGTGLSSVTIYIRYDTTVFQPISTAVSGSTQDVFLGSLTNATGWSISSLQNTNPTGTIDQLKIGLSTTTNITTTAGGSLALVNLHIKSTAPTGTAALNLYNDPLFPSSSHPRITINDSAFQPYILTPGPTTASTDAVDGLLTVTPGVPLAANDSYSLAERDAPGDPGLTLTGANGALANDSGGTPPLTAVLDSQPAKGALTNFSTSNGSFTYTPNLDFHGTDSFTYHVLDSTSTSSNEATVTITVNTLSTAHLSIPITLSAMRGGTVVVPVNLANPNPNGRTGLSGGAIDISYDPTIFTNNGLFTGGSPDLAIGAMLASAGWTVSDLSANQHLVNAHQMDMFIQMSNALTNDPAVTNTAGGSLVLMTFHIAGNAPAGAQSIFLPSSTTAGSGTSLNDATTTYTLYPLPAAPGSGPVAGVDGAVTILTGLPTTTAVSSSASASLFGQNVTFTATVTGSGTPTGTVQFIIDGSNYGSAVTLAGGSATVSDAALSVGTHAVTASYSGDSNFTTSSGLLSGGQTVSKASSATVVGSSAITSVFGQNVTFTATVSAVGPGAGTPGGTVQFVIDGSNYGSAVSLAGGSATVSDAALSVGTHTVKANYNGDANFITSTGTLTGGQTVNKAGSSTAVSSTVNGSVFGQNVTFTATVSAVSPGAGTPSGTVQFVIDGGNYGSAVSLAGGSATVSDAALSVGTHTVTATYAGDGNFSTGTGTLTGGQTVNKALSNTSFSSSVNASVFGQSVTFMATVSAVGPGAGTPSGTVQFAIDGSNYGGAVPLFGGSATVSDAALSVGTHTVVANYSGDASFTTSGGSLAGGETVTKASSSGTVSSSVNASVFGQTVTFTATVSVVSPGAGSVSGTVQFAIDGSNFGSAAALAGGSATISNAALGAGTHAITASYSGDSNFTTSTGTLSGGQVVDKISTSGSGQTAPVNTAFASPLVVTIVDQLNNPVSGMLIGFAAPGSGASASFSNAQASISGTTNSSGQISETITANSVAGSYTITVSVNGASAPTSFSLTNTAQAASQFLVTPLNSPVAAGQNLVFTVQAEDSSGNPTGQVSGPVSFTTTDPQVPTLPGGSLNSNGYGVFFGIFKTAAGGPWTITATAGSAHGTSTGITVTPGSATRFAVSGPATVTTGTASNITVTTKDAYGNTVTGYNGTVKLTSTDSAAGGLVTSYQFTTTGGSPDNGVHTFSVTLNTSGNQTVTATDTTSTNPVIAGTSAAITTRGLVVTSVTATSTGFTATFSKPVKLLNGTTALVNVIDVTLTGTVTNPGFVIPGSVLFSNNNQTITFVATNLELPDDTYTLDLTSSGNASPPSGAAAGFQDLSGAPLDGGNNAGTADYMTNFATTYNAQLTVSVPGFARGPGQPVNVDLVNFKHASSAAGIPVQLTLNAGSGSVTATTLSFVLSYNANLLTIAPVTNVSSPAGGTYSVATAGAGANATATFSYTPFGSVTVTGGSAPVTIGQLSATVPSAAAYKTKWLLHLGTLAVQNGASTVPAVGQDGVEVAAYLGNASGLGSYSPLDASLMASFSNTGAVFPNFPLADPNLVAGIDGAIDPNSISQVLQFNLNKPVPGIPAYTGAPSNNPSGPDPALAVGSGQWAVGSGQVRVPVNIDDPHPAGSTGLMLATLALTYDPKEFSISPQDIHLGTVPKAGTGWILATAVDPQRGQIGITLYSLTPISSGSGGSLVTIDFHVLAGAAAGASPIELVAAVNVSGQEIETGLADNQGFLTLHQAAASGFIPGLDGVIVVTGTAVVTETAPASEVAGRGPVTTTETAGALPPAGGGEDGAVQEMAAASVHGAAAVLLGAMLPGPSVGANLILGVGAALPAGALPMPVPGSQKVQRLVEQVLVEQAHALPVPAGQSSLDALLWDATDLGPDWLANPGPGAQPAANDSAAAEWLALDECFAHGADELE